MAARTPPAPITWTAMRGMNSAEPATNVSQVNATDAANVLIEPGCLGRRRPSAETVSLTSGPSNTIFQLARYQAAEAAATPDGQLFAFSGSGATAEFHRLASGTWSSVTASDTVTAFDATYRPQAVVHNGKLFIAYASDANRLHVYDPDFSTSALRRVGVVASAAATVANTGSGSYAATIRYYKIQFKVINGTTVVATSELSASVSFTPSGSGTAARVTKPTTPDSATHWVVFGSDDNVTYYNVSGNVAVGTTTYDDSADPATYSSGTVAPTAGLSIPPPAAKYLLSDGGRLLMAGKWQKDKTSGLTPTDPIGSSRVWFTDILGARENTGEDESIPHATDYKGWVDVGENDGDVIVGLGGPLDGVVYVFKRRSIWRLTPTLIPTAPYQAIRVTNTCGATWQDGIGMGEDGTGNPCLYFQSATGPKRIGVSGIEDLGTDIRTPTETQPTAIGSTPVVLWDQRRRICWWLTYDSQTTYAFQPQYEQRTSDGVRHGWTRHTIASGASFNENLCAVLFELSTVLVPYIGGDAQGAALASLSGSARRDVSSAAINASVTSPIFQVAGPLTRTGFGSPVLEWTYPGAATAISVSVASAIGGPLAVTGTFTDTTSSSTYSQSIVQEKLEGIQLSDVFGIQITVTWDTAVDGTQRPRINGITVPVVSQGGA